MAAVSYPRSAATASSAADFDAALVVADGTAGVIIWRLGEAGTSALSEDTLGVDSRRSRRIPMPNGIRVISIALRPAVGGHSHQAPLLACGCDQGRVVLLALPHEAVVRATNLAPVRVLEVSTAGNLSLLAWSADGEWLYAGSHTGVSCIKLPHDQDE